jgi:hypothetical protein
LAGGRLEKSPVGEKLGSVARRVRHADRQDCGTTKLRKSGCPVRAILPAIGLANLKQ